MGRKSILAGVLIAHVGMAAGCGGAEAPNPLVNEPGAIDPELTETVRGHLMKGQPGALNGDGDYCNDPNFPCAAGEGDCDSASQCDQTAGLTCGADNGPKFGLGSFVDVCVPEHCVDGIQNEGETIIDCGGECGTVCGNQGSNGDANHCSTTFPCEAGFGDCDFDAECKSGLVCAADVGGKFALSSTVDMCVPAHCTDGILNEGETIIDCGGECGTKCGHSGAPGSTDYCSPAFPCGSGLGDCDSNADCDKSAGLICGTDNGAKFGFGLFADVCVPAQCENGQLDPGETTVDCGGECGTVCGHVGDPGSANYCSVRFPCGFRMGDCDNDSECTQGLYCVEDVGANYGFGLFADICLNSCSDGIQSGDEEDVDCGGALCSPCGGATTALWINEIHYDDASTDEYEGIEVAGTAGQDLEGWSLELYNGGSTGQGARYAAYPLSGVIPNEKGGFGALWFDAPGIQNGPNDGIALVRPNGEVEQFLSYEGTVTATNGAAAGMTSVDIGVSEGGSVADSSLQLTGVGSTYSLFTWAPEGPAASRGRINANQTIQ